MKLLLLVTLLWLPPTHAQADNKGQLCQPVGTTQAESSIRLFQHGMDLMQLQFVGVAPDRFFSNTGKGIYTQFATKKNSVSPLVNKVVKSSTLTVDFPEGGGASLSWANGKKIISYTCGRD